ncbi:hypothetical protein Pint_29363 [Pistacia integerrima]|uniref:Uncharacterized protein n=1 Tax=Pistacia integerrima TaxID=434235 RepID=A0ACC0X0F1_9ROSI|nr:hypothetical protein Pint_29363 [Pistacia integerrima]
MSFIRSTSNPTELQKREYVNMVIGNFTDFIKEICEMGGRKFAFQNVGPLGCLPLLKQEYNLSGGACVEVLQEFASLHNSLLSSITMELQSQISGFKYLIIDSYRDYECRRVKEYELRNNPNDYVFFDGDHQSEHANSISSNFLWNGGSGFTWPLSMKQFYELNSTTAIEILSEGRLQPHIL